MPVPPLEMLVRKLWDCRQRLWSRGIGSLSPDLARWFAIPAIAWQNSRYVAGAGYGDVLGGRSWFAPEARPGIVQSGQMPVSLPCTPPFPDRRLPCHQSGYVAVIACGSRRGQLRAGTPKTSAEILGATRGGAAKGNQHWQARCMTVPATSVQRPAAGAGSDTKFMVENRNLAYRNA